VRIIHDKWVISTRDIVAELECSHRLHLEWAVITKSVEKPTNEISPELELLAEIGLTHESKIAESLRNSGTYLDIGFKRPAPNSKATYTIRHIDCYRL
jgi:hypothetical protein